MTITDKQLKHLLDRYLKGEATAEEVQLLDRFFDTYRPPENQIQMENDDVRREVYARILKATVARQEKPVLRLWLAAAAAVSLLAVTAAFFVLRTKPTGRNELSAVKTLYDSAPRGQKVTLELSEGTKITLNGGTSISYPERFGDMREVTVSGEAYFEVAKDPSKPFLVHARGTTTRVVGTAFNVNTTNDLTVAVTLVEGKVKVTSGSGSTADLAPNEQALIDGSARISKTIVDVEKFISWKKNILYFEDTSLGSAAQILENWYDVHIIVADPSLKNCAITAKYENESLENVLNSLQFLLNITIEHQEDHSIILKGKGCK